jgi:hypothetical protein
LEQSVINFMSSYGIFIVIGLGVGLAFIPAKIAKEKGYSYGAFWCLSFFGTFIVGIIVALCITDKRTRMYQSQYGQPYQPPVPPLQYQPPYAQTQTITCPKCGCGIDAASVFCKKCGEKLR